MTKLDWDRERRGRAAREKGTVRAGAGVVRAVPASDKLVDRLAKLGYPGPRPATAALAHELIRGARQRQDEAGKPLKDVAAAIERLTGQLRPTWAEELPKLWANLRTAYEREGDAITASRAKTTTKWDRELKLTAEHMRLKRRLRKLELRLD